MYQITPLAYGLDYSQSLFMGVYIFDEPLKNLDKAEKILVKFRGIGKADFLLGMIQKIRAKSK